MNYESQRESHPKDIGKLPKERLTLWMVIWPGLALGSVVYGVNMFGDAVRDIIDPRLKGGAGRYGVRVKKEAAVKSNEEEKEE